MNNVVTTHTQEGGQAMRQFRMTGVELRCAREYLGIPVDVLATILDVQERSVRRWEMGSPIPVGIEGLVDGMTKAAAQSVLDLVEATRGMATPTINMHDLYTANPHRTEAYLRAIAYRAAQHIPGCRII